MNDAEFLHLALLTDVEKAIATLCSDRGVSISKTKESLEDLADNIQSRIDALIAFTPEAP